MRSFSHSRARLPPSPPAPFAYEGRRGNLGTLMPETGDGTQGLAKKSTPVSYILLLTGRRRGLDALISHFPNVPLLYRKVMVFEYIIRYSPCRRASPCIAAGLSLTARAVERNKFSISISPTTRGAYRIYSSSHKG